MNKSILESRHGDMLLFRMSVAPKGAKSRNTNKLVVGLGESSGHKHVIRPIGTAEIIEFSDNENDLDNAIADLISFQIKGGNAVILHEEHGPILLEEGFYTRNNQVEYNPFDKMLAKVSD